MIGDSLGAYRIVGKLGQGGRGEPSGIQGPPQVVRNADPLPGGSRFAAVVYSSLPSSLGVQVEINRLHELKR